MMILKILLAFLIFLIAETSSGQEKQFIDKVLDDKYCKNCYLIAFDVASDSYSGRVVIRNGKLFKFLNKTEGMSKEQAQEFMRNLLLNNQSLVIKNASRNGDFVIVKGISENEFRVVKDVEKVNEISAKGCTNFIKYYFLGESLISNVNSGIDECHDFVRSQSEDLMLKRTNTGITDVNSVVNKLFEWQIPIMIDDMSGLPIIYRSSMKRSIATPKH